MGIIGKIFGKSKPSVIKRIMDSPEDYELVARIEGEEVAIKIREKNMPHNEETTSKPNKEETTMEKLKTKVKNWYEEHEEEIGTYAAAYVSSMILTIPVMIIGVAAQAYFNNKFAK